jgi:hypothetical protein
MRCALGLVLFIVGAFLSVGGIVTLASSRSPGDLAQSAVIEIGLAYLALGLFFGFGGWQLARRSRTPEAP